MSVSCKRTNWYSEKDGKKALSFDFRKRSSATGLASIRCMDRTTCRESVGRDEGASTAMQCMLAIEKQKPNKSHCGAH